MFVKSAHTQSRQVIEKENIHVFAAEQMLRTLTRKYCTCYQMVLGN